MLLWAYFFRDQAVHSSVVFFENQKAEKSRLFGAETKNKKNNFCLQTISRFILHSASGLLNFTQLLDNSVFHFCKRNMNKTSSGLRALKVFLFSAVAVPPLWGHQNNCLSFFNPYFPNLHYNPVSSVSEIACEIQKSTLA